MSPSKESVFSAGLLSQAIGVVDQDLGLFLSKVHEVGASDLEDMIDEPYKADPFARGGSPLKMTGAKQENTRTIKLVKLRTKRDGVFMTFSSGVGPVQTSFW